MSEQKEMNKLPMLSALIISGILFLYVAQMNPSAVLTVIMEDLDLTTAQGGLGISIIFVPIIIFALIGPFIQQKIGLKKMYALTLLTGGLGIALNLVATTNALFMVGRILYGIGFGLGTPFIGAAIMHWYNPKQQVRMNTLNALFPYIGNVLVFGLTVPLMNVFGGSWGMALAIWGIFCLVILTVWMVGVKDEGPIQADEAGEVATDKNVYLNLLKRKEIIILIIIFVCDFISYSIVGSMLPTYYVDEAGYTLEMANNLSLIFPAAGIIGGIVAFLYMEKSGRRKGLLMIGQAMKAVGLIMFFIAGTSPLGFFGIGLVGMGNCIWIPPMFEVPMELENMTPTLVGAAFALITSCGFVSGFIAPVVAGWMGDNFTLRLAMALCAIPCLLGLLAASMIRETGPGAKKK